MSFRQFPATDANGESRIIIEFKADAAADAADPNPPRYELEDGRILTRHGREFSTSDGDLRLHI